jgi:hypothetical protein
MERIIVLLFTLILTQVIISCSNDTFEEIKIGMTYEEVESKLDKPIAIERGANQFEIDYDKISSDIAFRINLDTTIEMSSKRWFAPNVINRIGQLIYVSWVYDDFKVDTFFVVLDTYSEKEDTLKEKVPVYYLGSRRVSYQDYEKSTGTEYKLKDGRIVTKSYYESYKRLNPNDVLEPIKAEKKILYENKKQTKTSQIKAGIEKVYYLVSYKNCILFDASSGRVVDKGFFPYDIKLLNH